MNGDIRVACCVVRGAGAPIIMLNSITRIDALVWASLFNILLYAFDLAYSQYYSTKPQSIKLCNGSCLTY